MSDLVKVISASSQAEAKMYEEILRRNRIPCRLIQDNPSGMLSARYGGAELPVAIIDIQVKAADLELAKSFLPESPFQPSSSPQRKTAGLIYIFYFVAAFVIFWLITRFVI